MGGSNEMLALHSRRTVLFLDSVVPSGGKGKERWLWRGSAVPFAR